MNNQEIMNALESLHNPNVYNQALTDCKSMLNLSKETLEEHLLSWLWVSEDTPAYEGGELEYVIQLGHIEEKLVEESLIYND